MNRATERMLDDQRVLHAHTFSVPLVDEATIVELEHREALLLDRLAPAERTLAIRLEVEANRRLDAAILGVPSDGARSMGGA
jgi:hypothetical protein